jgi:hypothetical protein
MAAAAAVVATAAVAAVVAAAVAAASLARAAEYKEPRQFCTRSTAALVSVWPTLSYSSSATVCASGSSDSGALISWSVDALLKTLFGCASPACRTLSTYIYIYTYTDHKCMVMSTRCRIRSCSKHCHDVCWLLSFDVRCFRLQTFC